MMQKLLYGVVVLTAFSSVASFSQRFDRYSALVVHGRCRSEGVISSRRHLVVSDNTPEADDVGTLMGHDGDVHTQPTSRRGILTSAATIGAGVATTLFARTASAATPPSTPLGLYEDPTCKFSIQLPTDWTKTEQTLPDRRKIVLYIKPDSDQKTLVFLAYTPVRADFTSLGSFGTVDEVAQATILPKGEIANVVNVESNMISASSQKQAYFFDYVQTVPPQPETHFRTIFTLANGATGGAGSVLVTITAQTPESDYATMKPLFDEIMTTYKYSA